MNMLMQQPQMVVQMETAANVLAAQAKAQIEARYMVALSRPRDWETVRQNLKKECQRPAFANNTSTYYKKPVGSGKFVAGLGIRFTEVAIRCMTNVLTETTMIFEDHEKEIHRVSVTDLESNTTYPQDIKINKTVERKFASGREVVGERLNSNNEKVFIVIATEDEMLNKRNSAISKTIRNLALRIIPGDLQDEMEQIILHVRQSGIQDDPEAHKKQIIDSFATIGVTVANLSVYLGCPVAQCSPAQIEDLRMIFGAIKTGETTWQTIIADKEEQNAHEGKASGKSAIDAINSQIAGSQA